jgi:hypothetical protein
MKPTQITENIHVGCMHDAINITFLQENKIQVMLNVAQELKHYSETNSPQGVEHYFAGIKDNCTQIDDLESTLNRANQVIEQAVKQNKNILIFSARGISRALIVLMYHLHVQYPEDSWQDLFQLVKHVRPFIFIHWDIKKQLLSFWNNNNTANIANNTNNTDTITNIANTIINNKEKLDIVERIDDTIGTHDNLVQ